ncbi:chromosome segregation ATPase [Catenulispora sp. GP43]|jgi:chromosome segregation ATPase|uniref:hypothetical protein n=1 Tax=Catenulispora sp. GP43 TaxID=3156263 RepID=UPI00351405F4
MELIRRIADALRYGRDGHSDPAAQLTTARWRQRAMLADLLRDLDELADERAYVDTEIARSRTTVARLESDAAAADADGSADVARELREERLQAHAFLTELLDVRQAMDTEQTRLLRLRKRLEEHVAQAEALAGRLGTGGPDDVRALVHQVVDDTAGLAGDEQDRLEAGF